MSTQDPNTSPGGHTGGAADGTQSTRQPTQLAVLLASAGTPPLDAEQARLAAVNLFDQFVLGPDRAGLFFGEARSLFSVTGEGIDPRHDALARIVRVLGGALRQRLESHEVLSGGIALVKNIPSLAYSRVEGAVTGFDLRRTGGVLYTADLLLGNRTPGLDPLEAPDAGVLRRVLALATRGLMVPRATRSGGVVADLGAVTLLLGLIDLLANPRSALRSARARLAKNRRMGEDETVRVRDVGQVLRELMAHAVSSATNAGAAGRELVKESVLTPDLMDHLTVAIVRAVYDGLAPDEEHPLVVPAADDTDALTVAPLPSLATNEENPGGPVLGLYRRIAFVHLPWARILPGEPLRETGRESIAPPRPMVLDEGSFARVREALKTNPAAARAITAVSVLADAVIDPNDARHVWRRTSPTMTPSLVLRAQDAESALQWVLFVGPRSGLHRDALQSFGDALTNKGPWSLLVPRITTRSLAFEPLTAETAAGPVLRRADLSAWLDNEVLRSIDFTLPAGGKLALYCGPIETDTAVKVDLLVRLARSIADKSQPKALLILQSVSSYAEAESVLVALSQHPELAFGDAPLRPGALSMVRTDAPLSTRGQPARGIDESILAALAGTWAPTSALADAAGRWALMPPEARYRGRLLRLTALGLASPDLQKLFTDQRRALEASAADPWSGDAMRRALLAGVLSHPVARAAISAGMAHELSFCMRHELQVLTSEWEGTRPRSHTARLADVARGLLVELVLAAHPRASVLVSDALAAALANAPTELYDKSAPLEVLLTSALGSRPVGSIYAREEARSSVALGFTLRGAGADLVALIDVTVGAMLPRTVAAPCVELSWRPGSEREASLGSVATLLTTLHEATRRWTSDVPARTVSRDARPGFAAFIDVAIDQRMNLESVRVALPMRDKIATTDAQKTVVELGAKLAAVLGGDAAAEWSAAYIDGKTPVGTALAVSEALLAQECADRWLRALRVLPRHFPSATGLNSRFSTEAEIGTGAELGLTLAFLAEKRVASGSPEGKSLLARLAGVVPDVLPRAKELAGHLPLKSGFASGNDLEWFERVLSVAWFLHVNFCVTSAGALRWSPPDAPGGQAAVSKMLDLELFRTWLQRKGTKIPALEQRASQAIAALEPNVVVG